MEASPPKRPLGELESLYRKWAKDGDPESQDKFLGAANTHVFRLAYRLLDQREDAEDVSQQVLMKIIKQGEAAKDEIREFEAWIYTLTLNEIRNHVRSNAKRKERERAKGDLDVKLLEEAKGPKSAPGKSSAPPLVDEISAVQNAVWAALADLPAELREPLVLHYSDALSKIRVAELLDVPESTIRVRLHRGLHQLRNLLLIRNVGPSAVALSWFLRMLPEKYISFPGVEGRSSQAGTPA